MVAHVRNSIELKVGFGEELFLSKLDGVMWTVIVDTVNDELLFNTLILKSFLNSFMPIDKDRRNKDVHRLKSMK